MLKSPAMVLSEKILQTSIQGLEAHLRFLQDERRRVDGKIVEIDETLRHLRKALAESVEQGISPEKGSSRRKRGDNSRRIGEWFDVHQGEGFTIPDIMAGTELPHSSVHAVVTKEEDRYRRDEEGRWWKILADLKEKGENIFDGKLLSP